MNICTATITTGCVSVAGDDGLIRTSAGFSLIWDSPLGPLRADVGFPITKDPVDKTQYFRFGAATKF